MATAAPAENQPPDIQPASAPWPALLAWHVLEQLPSPVMVLRRKGPAWNTVYLNTQFKKVLGYALHEVPDETAWLRQAWPQADYQQWAAEQWRTSLNKGESSELMLRIHCKSGSDRWFCVRLAHWQDYKFATFEDIHELEQTRQQLTEGDRLKDNLFSMLSHDLRSPFHSVLGLTHLIATVIETDTETAVEPVREYVGLIESIVGNALRMLDELLSIARYGNGSVTVRRTPTRLRSLLDRVVARHQFSLARRNQRVRLDDSVDTEVFCDEGKTEQILDNLISNAGKYSPEHTEITVAVERNGTVRICVTDQGPGLTAEDRARLFTRFGKLSAKPAAGEESTGLGLYISKMLAEWQGGDLGAVSAGPGKGTTFVLSLPG
ncbi:MAG: PAS domain-containing sensor histidine kinase [Cytophagales bacterium]|jgi:PAS domain S-box-containing protein|nr:PAS domain-containing sensor histidine kinase [Cytophagales bacterium]